MKMLRLFALVLAVLAAAFILPTAIFGQTPPADQVPTATTHALSSIFTWDFLKKCMEIGLGVFVFIMGLKNVPFFADFFAAWPKLAVYVNALMAVCAGILACLLMPAHDAKFYMCIAVTIGTFLSAAGIHMTVLKLSPDNSQSPSINQPRLDKLNSK